MDLQSAMASLNWLAVIVAALSAFLIGGIWYSPATFGKAWMRENGFTEESLKQGNMGKIFGGTFGLMLFASFNLAMFIGPQADAAYGGMAGFLAGFGWVMTMVGTHYLFERKSFTLFAINSGYSIVALTLMGIILGVWK